MRICSPQLGISPLSILGGEIYDREILKGLAKLGHHIEIILPQGKSHDQIANWRITEVPLKHVVPPHLFNLLIFPYLISIYRNRPFDVLRVHAPTFVGLGAVFFKKVYPRVPLVGVYHFLGEGGILEKWIDPIVLPKFSAVITDSEYMRRKIIERFRYPERKIFAIHNGVDPILKPMPKDRVLIKKLGLQHKVVLLFMGLFIERKNPLFLVSLMRDIVKKNKHIILVMCGEGSLEGEIKKKIVNYGLQSSVIIHPPVFDQDKVRLMSIADIFVHPAVEEGFSLAIIEAMVMNLPSVITDGFSAREAIIDGKTGYLAKKNNINDWLSKLYKLFQDSSKRKWMGKNAHKVAQVSFNWSNATRQTADILTSLEKISPQDS